MTALNLIFQHRLMSNPAVYLDSHYMTFGATSPWLHAPFCAVWLRLVPYSRTIMGCQIWGAVTRLVCSRRMSSFPSAILPLYHVSIVSMVFFPGYLTCAVRTCTLSWAQLCRPRTFPRICALSLLSSMGWSVFCFGPGHNDVSVVSDHVRLARL